MSQFAAEIIGDKKLMRQLRALGEKGAKNAAKAGIRKGQTVMKQGIRSAIPPHAKSIRKAVNSVYDERKFKAKVGLNIGRRKGRGYAPHAAMYVLGTKPRYTKSGKFTGVMPANPVVKKGLQASEQKAREAIRQKLLERLKQEAGKI